MDQILFIINGSSKQSKAIHNEIIRQFDPNSYTIETTQYAGHAREIAAQAVIAGYRKIISAGGDGSLNETLNGIMHAATALSEDEKKKLRLGVIPIGTGNDFIRTTGSPATIAGIRKSIENDQTIIIDIGQVSYFSEIKTAQQRYFVNVADIGLGGYVAKRLNQSSRFLTPFLTYQKAIIQSLLAYRKINLTAKIDDFKYQGNTMLIAVANGKYFGSGIGIAPEADPTNGKFSVIIVGNASKWEYIRNIGDARKCKPLKLKEIIYRQAEHIFIESKDGEMPVDMDGEFIGYGPVEIHVIPAMIRFYY
jgi:YegS/Rv2252/BmrU family lipid kinase